MPAEGSFINFQFAVAEALDSTAPPALIEVELAWIKSAGFRHYLRQPLDSEHTPVKPCVAPVAVEVKQCGERGWGRWPFVFPAPGCGTHRQEDSLLGRYGDAQRCIICFLEKLC